MIVYKNSKNNNIDVYFAPVSMTDVFLPLEPKEREAELLSVSNEHVRREKYFAWLLLEHALKKSLDLSLEEAELYKDKSGKWHSKKCEFSLSHSSSCVAVVISHAPVGIDIELADTKFRSGFANKKGTAGAVTGFVPVIPI